ncbi:MAG: methylmalonyl-CoA mutase family protein, partial [Actinomycetes bacterium]
MTDQPISRRTSSDIAVNELYTQADLEGFDPSVALGNPGSFPYTRGVHAE